MNEQLQEILETVGRTAREVGDVAGDVASGVGKKATMLLDLGKLNIRVVDLKAEINLGLREVGELMYATHTGAPTDSEVLLAKLRALDDLYTRLQEFHAQIAHLQGGAACPGCGAAAKGSDLFCRECGKHLS